MSHDPTPTTTGEMLGRPLRRRDVLALAGTAGVGAAFGFRHVLLPTSDAYAAGEYSGVAGVSGNWLRGVQRTGSGGRVRFETVFPGWYRGRTPHIHMKVFVGGDEVHTGQVFFRPAVTRTVYGQGAYAARGQQDTSNAADMIYREAGSRALVSLKRKGSAVSSGYTGSMTIGVRR